MGTNYLVSAKEILSANKKLRYFGGTPLVKAFMGLIRLNKFNRFYARCSHLPALEFNREVFREFGISYQVSEDELKKIPETGPYIIISNHPTGGPEALILTHIFMEHRPDFKFMANFLMTRVEPLKNNLLAVNPFENHKDAFSSLGGIKNAMLHLNSGAGLGIFPAGEVSSYQKKYNCITDKDWNPVIIKMIKRANVPVIPVYVEAKNSRLFYLLGKINPVLRTLKIPSEFLNKKNKPFKICIGNPICAADFNAFSDLNDFGEFLRFKTYSLANNLNSVSKSTAVSFEIPVISEIQKERLKKDVSELPVANRLSSVEEYDVFFASASQIPNILQEIGRLREITYREVGEGTGKEIDIDAYDSFYHHLFIWDRTEECIVGAYRMGKGKELFAQNGINGFYTHSLFDISEKMYADLEITIELGRSFIRREYQKKPLSLFLLWKGILYFLIKNPEYRYLLGPVSISDSFSDLSKGIILEFLKKYYTHPTLTEWIKPKNPFGYNLSAHFNSDLILKYTGNDISKLDKIIHDIEPEQRIPVLLKKYLKQNATILAANVDPKFNYCLDVLMLLDLKDAPPDVIDSLSKEISDIGTPKE
jgi:putative hemolysin